MTFRQFTAYYHTGVASDRPGMDRSTDPDGGPIHGEILKLPHNEVFCIKNDELCIENSELCI